MFNPKKYLGIKYSGHPGHYEKPQQRMIAIVKREKNAGQRHRK